MATLIYTAKRNLKSGHSVGTEYTITTDIIRQDDEQPTPVKNEHISISGNVVTVLHRIEEYAELTVAHIATSGGTPDVDDYAEFFHSVAGGEVFEFNDGTARNCIMAGKVTRTRFGLKFNYSFRVRFV